MQFAEHFNENIQALRRELLEETVVIGEYHFFTIHELVRKGKWSASQYEEHVLPLLSFAQHADSKAFRKECLEIQEGNNRRVGLTASTVVVAGTAMQGTAVSRIVTTTTQTTATTT